jgi:hypothetical protein
VEPECPILWGGPRKPLAIVLLRTCAPSGERIDSFIPRHEKNYFISKRSCKADKNVRFLVILAIFFQRELLPTSGAKWVLKM